jgi:hypothetical protein
MAEPPYLITRVLPLNRLIKGSASEKMAALPIVDAILGFAA